MTKFHGWYVLAACFITATIMTGATFYSYTHFVIPLEEDFGLSRDQSSLGYIGFLVSAGIWAAIIGKFSKRVSPRKLALFGILAFCGSFGLLSIAKSAWQLLAIVIAPMGFGFTACGPFISNILTTNWFYENRGKALGIVAIASSMGGVTIQPIFGYLIDNHSWRLACLVMGGAMLILAAPIILKFFINKPEDIGQYPDGGSKPIPQATVAAEPSKIIHNRDFWLIALACGLLLGCDQALLLSLKPLGKSLGYTNAQATLIPTIVAGSAIAGKLGIGWLVDRFDKRKIFQLVCLSNILFLLAVAYANSFETLIVVAAFVGIAIGGIYPVWTSITADTFGRDNFGPALGFMNIITMMCAVAAIIYVSTSFEANNKSYIPAFKSLVPMAVMAGIVMMFVRTKRSDNA